MVIIRLLPKWFSSAFKSQGSGVNCQMGACSDKYFLSKTAVKRNNLGTLYRVEEEQFIYQNPIDGGDPSRSQKRASTNYVFCSTQKPAHMWSNEDKNWMANFLNPGSFTKAGIREAIVDFTDCESHAHHWGGSVLLRRINNEWTRVSYEKGFRSNMCLTVR